MTEKDKETRELALRIGKVVVGADVNVGLSALVRVVIACTRRIGIADSRALEKITEAYRGTEV